MDVDVAIVGGGIAGSALAVVLAREGLGVVVLERQETYRDQVRGEGLWPWGVGEAQRLGVHDALLAAAGGRHVEWLVDYMDGADPEGAESEPVPLSQMVAGARGALNVGHPLACNTLAAMASDRGAEVVAGVDRIQVEIGAQPKVHFSANGTVGHIQCRLIVGADGRNSVVRRQVGIPLERDFASHMVSGLLVEGLGIDPARDVAGIGDNVFMVMFPQAPNKVRVYLFYRNGCHSFSGPDGAQRLISSLALAFVAKGDNWVQAVPAGPCRSFRCDDTWTDRPYDHGVVLVGDAAGYNDPLIGQGLSLALRDVRALSELLLDGSPWDTKSLKRYGSERAERLRRMRSVANLYATETIAFGPAARESRARIQKRIAAEPALLDGPLAMFLGPDEMNPEVATDDFNRRYFSM